MSETLTPVGFFALRTPALPWGVIEKWWCDVPVAGTITQEGHLETAFCRHVTLLRNRLRTIVKDPAVQSALYLASPILFRQIDPWLNGDESKQACRVERALVRYFMRMAGRATPFGLLAGTSIGLLAPRTALRVAPIATCVRDTRLDTEYVFDLADQLSKSSALLPEIRFRSTSTSYSSGRQLRYYESHFSGKLRTFNLVDVKRTPYLTAALNCATKERGSTLTEIADCVSSVFPDVPFDVAFEYVNKLVKAKLLCNTWSPALTGGDPAVELVEKLRGTNGGASLAAELNVTLAMIREIEALGFRAQPEHYERVVARLQSLRGKGDSASVFRTDLRKPGVVPTISHAIVNEVQHGVELLASIAGTSPDPAIRRFVGEFERKYQNSEVPLLQALDEENGIGFDVDGQSGSGTSHLLEGITFHKPATRTMPWDSRTAFLLKRLSEALHENATEITLSDTEVKALATRHRLELPVGLSVLASIAAASSEAADRGQYRIHVRKAFGPNCAKLLGRFCEGDAEMRAHVEGALRREEACDPDAIHAEIVHLPHRHSGNVICRPVLREYEIPLFDRSGASEARQIALTDLVISVQRGTVMLRSISHRRRVVPHLTCAHAFRECGVNLYRFLASLEEQGTFSELSFSWGPLSCAAYLPRVVHGKLVLALSNWNISGTILRRIDALAPSAAFSALQDLRAKLKLPRFVLLVDYDKALPVDFENALSLQSFVKVGKHMATLTLSEVFPAPNELLARGEDGHFHHELVIPFVRSAVARRELPTGERQVTSLNCEDRKKYPGSDYLFLKIYCGIAAGDRLLADVVGPLVAELRVERLIDRWFFIRYADPHWHLRLRFRGDPSTLWKNVALRLFACIRKACIPIQNIAVDTYDPEEERYGGGEGLEVAERIFEADSDAALSIIQEYQGNMEARWRLALIGMNAFLEAFGLSPDLKKQLVDACRLGQISQYEDQDTLKRQLGNKYRKFRPEIEILLHNPPDFYSRGVQIIHARCRRLAEIASILRRMEAEGRLQLSLLVVMGSCLHMWANRMFRSSTNLQEMMIYEFLYRMYLGQIKRSRQRP